METKTFTLGQIVNLKSVPDIKLIIVQVYGDGFYKCLYYNHITGLIVQEKIHGSALQESV
jgi:uncharacterized protein YodC (DUF2158 family)